MKSKVLFFVILSFLLFPFFVNKAYSSVTCSDWQCESWCDPDVGGCYNQCYCASQNTDNCGGSGSCSGGVGCGPGTYVCNRGCCDVGTDKPVKGGGGVDCNPTTVNCPAGTKVNYSNPVGDAFCMGPNKGCSSVGSAQTQVDCCHGFYDKGDCQEVCKIVKKTGYEICKTVCDGSGEFVCTNAKVQTYACESLAPPHSSTVSYTFLNPTSAYGCTANAGLMGKEASNTIRVTATVPNVSDNKNLAEVRTWLGTTPPTTDDHGTGLPQVLRNNHELGVMVRKSGSSWVDLYLPTIYDIADGQAKNSIQGWVKAGTVGNGKRAEIVGRYGNKLASVNNVTVSASGGNTTLVFELELYSEASGIATYEKVVDGTYTVSATPKYTTPTPYETKWPTSNAADFVIDLTNPVSNSLNVSVTETINLDVAWSFSDALSGVKRVLGDATISGATNPDTIDDTTSGVNNYVFGSGSTGSTTFGGSHLWTINALSRTEKIDLQNNRKGTITFSTIAFDRACNRAEASNSSFTMATPWITSKGGHVYGGSGLALDLRPITGHAGFSNDSYWNSPFAFYKDQSDYTSELVSVSSATVSSLLYPQNVGTFTSINHAERNNKAGYWYDELVKRSDSQVLKSPSSFVTLTYLNNLTASTNSTTLSSSGVDCVANKTCVVKVGGNLTINSNFVCNARTVFLVEGSTTVNPDITAPQFDKGCFIISKGDITVNEGTYKTNGGAYPVYDIIEAFMFTDGRINLPEVDSTTSRKDGLLVHGSMLAFGSAVTPSINFERTLNVVQNLSFPTVALHFDNRYLSLAALLFGGDNEGFRREVGFKPL